MPTEALSPRLRFAIIAPRAGFVKSNFEFLRGLKFDFYVQNIAYREVAPPGGALIDMYWSNWSKSTVTDCRSPRGERGLKLLIGMRVRQQAYPLYR